MALQSKQFFTHFAYTLDNYLQKQRIYVQQKVRKVSNISSKSLLPSLIISWLLHFPRAVHMNEASSAGQ